MRAALMLALVLLASPARAYICDAGCRNAQRALARQPVHWCTIVSRPHYFYQRCGGRVMRMTW